MATSISIQVLFLCLAFTHISTFVQAAPCENQIILLRSCLDGECPGRQCDDSFEPTSDCDEFNTFAGELFCCSRCYTETLAVASCLKQDVSQASRARQNEQGNSSDSTSTSSNTCVTMWPMCMDSNCPSSATPHDPCKSELEEFQYCPDYYLDDCIGCPSETVEMLSESVDSCEALNAKQCTLQNCCEPCGEKLRALITCRAAAMETDCPLATDCQVSDDSTTPSAPAEGYSALPVKKDPSPDDVGQERLPSVENSANKTATDGGDSESGSDTAANNDIQSQGESRASSLFVAGRPTIAMTTTSLFAVVAIIPAFV
jgi:hypothetical protein